jgi:hypothetical protein
MKMNRELFTRALVAALILMSGLALVPYLDLPQTTLGWEQFAGIYAPELVVEPESGRPGSVFTATGSNYPANSLATVYIDGEPIGTLFTDENGSATFYIYTVGGSIGTYNVTMAVDVNASATDTFELVADGALIPAPSELAGPIFYLTDVLFLPVIVKS